MLEVGEDIAARGEMLVDAGDHRLAFFGGVSGLAVAVVSEIGGDYVGSVALFRFGHTERDVALAQRVPRGVDERWLAQPRFVAELESRAHRSRQAFQKFGKHRLIRFEIRRQLKEQRAEASGAL